MIHWNRDELVLVLGLYIFIFRGGRINVNDRKIAKLARLINRSTRSVETRLRNFVACDKCVKEKGIPEGQNICQPIWDEYSENYVKLGDDVYSVWRKYIDLKYKLDEELKSLIPNQLYYVENIVQVHNPQSDDQEELDGTKRFRQQGESADYIDNEGQYQVVLFMENDVVEATIISVMGFQLRMMIPTGSIVELKENCYIEYQPESMVPFVSAEDNQVVQGRVGFLNGFIQELEKRKGDEDDFSNIVDSFSNKYKSVFSYHVNVGHGNCSIILTMNTPNDYCLWMVDCGLYDYTNRTHYNQNLDNCLDYIANKIGINKGKLKISYFLLTHTHYDHYSGLEYLFGKKYVDGNTIFLMNIWYGCMSQTWYRITKLLGTNMCKVLEPIKRNFLPDFILYPDSRLTYKNVSKVNNSSVVYSMEFNQKRIVFPGDLEKAGFHDMTKNSSCSPFIYRCDYYCISHHGSLNGHVDIPCVAKHCPSVLSCVRHKLKYSILMGRDKAFSGVYSPVVRQDFRTVLCYTQYAPNYLEIDWSSDNLTFK